jgi:hypothetical protein
MSFEPPEGILDIGNATLRVGKLEVAETSGLNQGLQNIIKNDLLITENTEYAVNHKWGLKLPTTWVAEFEVKGHSGKYIDFNFYNENSASNAQGYNLTFMDTSLTLRYDGGNPLGGVATIPTIVGAYRKVNIFFERGVISVSIDGTRYLYFKESDGYNQGLGVASRVVSTTGSAFVNLFIESDNENNSKFKNLRIVNGRFISDKTSNIAFIGGNLGVGVNSPKETLDIRGNMHLTRVSNVSQISVDSNVVTEYTGPHDRPLRKYPEVALTANDNSSTSGYVASKSSGSSTYDAWKAFDEDISTYWYSGSNSYYATSDGSATESAPLLDTGTDRGDWLAIEIPNGIKLESFKLTRHDASFPSSGTLYARNSSGDSWTEIYRYNGYTSGNTTQVFNVNSTIVYKIFALVGRAREQGANTTYGIAIKDWELYGHEEGSGSLDTTLKSVYNVPATTGTQLEVYYDAKDLTTMPGTVTDLSPNTNTGALSTSPPTLDTTDGIESFKFDASSNQYISSSTPISGNYVHTMSMWFKPTNLTATSGDAILFVGDNTDNNKIEVFMESDRINYTFKANDYQAYTQFLNNVWHHLTLTYNGQAGQNGREIYLNGEKLDGTHSGNSAVLAISNNALDLGRYTPSGTSTAYAFDGSIANFRLYSKVLNADQVKELYDYQKDYFLGSKSQVTLYKGHLGVGVTEPSGQLELAGDERIQEYPPRGMTGYETYMEGHGAFCVSASSTYSSYYPWEAFEHVDSDLGWHSLLSVDPFSGTNNAYSGSSAIGNYTGAFLKLKLPYKIELKSFSVRNRSDGSTNANSSPEDFKIIGSNDETNWEELFSISGVVWASTQINKIYSITSNPKTYRYLAFVCTRTVADTSVIIGHIKFFGTPGPTTLDKGSLTLGRSLDVPRISRYDVDTETPRPEKLVVDFDTTVNSSPTDISGQGNHGAFVGTAQYSSADKAFKFDGNQDFIETGSGSNVISGSNPPFTASVWINYSGSEQGYVTPFSIEPDTYGTNTNVWFYIRDTTKKPTLQFENNYVEFSEPGTSTGGATSNTWHHLTVSYNGSSAIGGRRCWLNGIEQVSSAVAGSAAGGTLTLGTTRLTIGSMHYNNNHIHEMIGFISNFKLYSVALEASEVQKLYRLGRTGRSMVISDTAVGIGKVPEAQLDVRGRTYSTRMEAQSMLVRSRNNRTWTAASQPWDGGGLTIAREEYPLDTTGARYWQFNMHSNYNLHISSNGRYTVWINQNAGNNALNFTGQHRCFIKDVPFTRANELEGLIVSSDQNKYIKMNNGIEKGSNAITTNESLPIVSLSKTHWDKKCFGVISASEDPENRTEQYGAFGSFFEKEEGDTRVYINSVGEGAIWVANTNGSLEAGDYISTSDISGYGQRQGSDYLKNYTVAKITMDCDFNPVSQPIEIIKKDEDGKNVLDAHGQIQWENHTTETEKAYKIRYLDASGAQTDESNAVHIAAFVGCTYHCG